MRLNYKQVEFKKKFKFTYVSGIFNFELKVQ